MQTAWPGPQPGSELPIAPPDHWRAQRAAPWSPGRTPRMIHFYVTIDDVVAVAPEYRFFHTPLGDQETTWENLPGYSKGPNYPPLPPLAASFAFFSTRRAAAEDHMDSLGELVSSLWDSAGPELSEGFVDSRDAAPSSYRTVVEITFHDPGNSSLRSPRGRESDGLPVDWLNLTRMWLQNLMEGYRIAAHLPVSSASYLDLGPFVVSVEIDLKNRVRTPPVISPLETATMFFQAGTQPRVQGEELADTMVQFSDRTHVEDPLMMYPLGIWRARRFAHVLGEYDAAIIYCSLATEGLLSGVWLAIQWEAGRDAAASIRKLNGTKRLGVSSGQLLGWLSHELGGHWDPSNDLAIRAWNDSVRQVRNLISHAGVRVSRGQALTALDAAAALYGKVEGSLIDSLSKYPRVAYLMAGSVGIDAAKGPSTWDRDFSGISSEPRWAHSLARWTRLGREANA